MELFCPAARPTNTLSWDLYDRRPAEVPRQVVPLASAFSPPAMCPRLVHSVARSENSPA